MRLLIPRVAKVQGLTTILPGSSSSTLVLLEPLEAYQLADAYIKLVQSVVWDKTGVTAAMACSPSGSYPGLCYKFPHTNDHGTTFGNSFLTCGAQGWQVSASQLNAFLRTLHFSAAILPEWLSNMMVDEHLGYDGVSKASTGMTYYYKQGKLSNGAGDLRALVIGFSNGVQVGLIVNSQFGGGLIMPQVVDAFEETYS
jgi:hypothetical protein